MSLPTLYELAAEYRDKLEKLYDTNLDQQTIDDTLESESGALQTKATNIGFVIRNMAGVADMKEAAAADLLNQVKAIRKREKYLEEYLLRNMQACAITKIESPVLTISLRNNPPKVVIDDPEAVPIEYWRQPAMPSPEIDKKAISEALKAGEVVEGAHLESGVSVVFR